MLNHVGSKAKSAPKAPVYEIHGPSFEAKGLPRRAAVKTMIEKIHDGGVAMATIDSLLNSVRLRAVPGTLDGDELFQRLVDVHGVSAEQPQAWFLDAPIHEGGKTWVINRDWGKGTNTRLDALAKLAESVGWSTSARLKGAVWSLDDVLDDLADDPEMTSFLRTLATGIEALGGRVWGTSALEPSVTFGVPGDGGEVWPYTFYVGELAQPLRLGFHFPARPEGSDERFLARIAPLLPSLDVEALRASDFTKWPAVSREDLLGEGVAESLAQAVEEYVGDGDTSRWSCILNDALSGQVLEMAASSASAGMSWTIS